MKKDINDIIKEIALRNNVRLSQDDPVLIVYTLHEMLLQEQQEQQNRLLDGFKSEMEALTQRWSDDTKAKSEKVLQASLDASKQTMVNVMQKNATETAQAVKNEVQKVPVMIADQMSQAKTLTYANIAASVVTLASACVVVYGLFMA